jgi:hypothetical protein
LGYKLMMEMQMQNLQTIVTEMTAAAQAAAQDHADKYYQGQDGGACGFAWVEVYPEHKGNTKLGKAERAQLKAMGFRVDWTGRAFQKWDPANWPGQSVDIKETGAVAAANVLKKYGFRAYSGSRLD